MADPLIVAPHERGVTRVFAVDLPKAGAEALREDNGAAIAAALGSGPLDMSHVEATEVEYWPSADPTAVQGSREQMLEAYRDVRDRLAKRMLERFGPPQQISA